jgi:hypothetical protein
MPPFSHAGLFGELHACLTIYPPHVGEPVKQISSLYWPHTLPQCSLLPAWGEPHIVGHSFNIVLESCTLVQRTKSPTSLDRRINSEERYLYHSVSWRTQKALPLNLNVSSVREGDRSSLTARNVGSVDSAPPSLTFGHRIITINFGASAATPHGGANAMGSAPALPGVHACGGSPTSAAGGSPLAPSIRIRGGTRGLPPAFGFGAPPRRRELPAPARPAPSSRPSICPAPWIRFCAAISRRRPLLRAPAASASASARWAASPRWPPGASSSSSPPPRHDPQPSRLAGSCPPAPSWRYRTSSPRSPSLSVAVSPLARSCRVPQ